MENKLFSEVSDCGGKRKERPFETGSFGFFGSLQANDLQAAGLRSQGSCLQSRRQTVQGIFFTVPNLIGLKWGTRPRESPPTGAAGGGGDHRADN